MTAAMPVCDKCRLQTCRLADLQTCRLADLQTCRLADLQTQHTGLSQFVLKIVLCNLRHSISCAVRLVRFDTWLLSRLSFWNKIRTCASFEKTLSNYLANSIIRAKFWKKNTILVIILHSKISGSGKRFDERGLLD